jgi:hypothetical protein
MIWAWQTYIKEPSLLGIRCFCVPLFMSFSCPKIRSKRKNGLLKVCLRDSFPSSKETHHGNPPLAQTIAAVYRLRRRPEAHPYRQDGDSHLVCDLTGTTPATLSRILPELVAAKIVNGKRIGLLIHYSLAPSPSTPAVGVEEEL